MGEESGKENAFVKTHNFIYNFFDKPVTWFHDVIVKPNQKSYPWYHQKFRRVPTIDQCYTDDVVCQFEADQQFKRDKMVDSEILNILRQRFEDCVHYEAPDEKRKCVDILELYNQASADWFTKYGDLGVYGQSKAAYMKQKHRMIWERRHGPVGSGMKTEDSEVLAH
ncbi:NADH dehydrogenase [ubiquinone] 1 beta subcomplex subunit 10 [Phlebotomus argentipes]|uniref:NADH dehydrogenase [ubiquinone] 1 beta subcomplex subunit 10 n=1 Tax=Phlebotomus argentipes TaxID=94469 RepID=UPI002892BCA1|nr:NADH dehydrogenase [ubiquinone] 1 beta subcomplex subunit 10 [Phlebotomus argentipes]